MENIEYRAQEVYEAIVARVHQTLLEIYQNKTQQDIADACGVAQPTINRLLKGHRGTNLPCLTVLKVVLAYEIDLSDILLLIPGTKLRQLQKLLEEIGGIIS